MASKPQFVYADFEHACTTQKETNLLFAQSKVPLQRLLSARRIGQTPLEFDDPIAIAAMLSRDGAYTVRHAVASQLGLLARAKLWKEEDNSRILAILLSLCRDADSVQVRMSAADSLAMIRHPGRLLAWFTLCRDKVSSDIRSAGAVCLGRVLLSASLDAQSTHTVALELLLLAKEDESLAVRKIALRCLAGSCTNPQLLKSSSSSGAGAAVVSAAVEACVAGAEDFAWPVRAGVCESVALVVAAASASSSGTAADKLAGVLLKLTETDESAAVRKAGRHNLGWFLAQNSSSLSSTGTTDQLLLASYCKLATAEEEDLRFAFAFYLPGVLMRHPQAWSSSSELLRPSFVLVSNDMSGRIRRSLAHSLHLLAQHLPPSSSSVEAELLPVFYSYLADMDDEEEVKLGAVRAAGRFLLALRALMSSSVVVGEAFAKVCECLEELNSPECISLAVSRDARLALAADLPLFIDLQQQQQLQGGDGGDQFVRFVLRLAEDQAQLVRERAVESLGLVVSDNSSSLLMQRVMRWGQPDQHHSWRYLYCLAAKSFKTHNNTNSYNLLSPRLASLAASDPVLTVREAAAKAMA